MITDKENDILWMCFSILCQPLNVQYNFYMNMDISPIVSTHQDKLRIATNFFYRIISEYQYFWEDHFSILYAKNGLMCELTSILSKIDGCKDKVWFFHKNNYELHKLYHLAELILKKIDLPIDNNIPKSIKAADYLELYL